MFCRECGKEINENDKFCPNCGASLIKKETTEVKQNAIQDSDSGWWSVLGFFIPIVGLILFLVWEKEKPIAAKKCGKGALISVIVGISLSVIFTIVMFILMFISLQMY